jgi:colanic acid biosynthesis glycosyl transferase WcaI
VKILLLNQAFHPDVVATAQYAADLAVRLAGGGHEVTVISSRRPYDGGSRLFAATETWRGVLIRRISHWDLGKSGRWRRALNFGSYLLCCVFRMLTLPRFDVVIALTSPPLVAFLAALFVRARGGRLIFWVMDLNPDEAVAAGWLRPESLAARLLSWMLRFSLQASARVIALDRFMAARLREKGVEQERIAVIPPWPLGAASSFNAEGRVAFRRKHGLERKFVVMYSGNHSPCHPLSTLMQAAERLRDRPEVVFCFIGGGSRFASVGEFADRRALGNFLLLPYQPLEQLSDSLSAADLHVVVMGDAFVGIVHPSKVYNILSVGIPALYIGPAPSHVTELASDGDIRIAEHGDVDTVVRHISERLDSQARAVPVSNACPPSAAVDRLIEVVESCDASQARSAAAGTVVIG